MLLLAQQQQQQQATGQLDLASLQELLATCADEEERKLLVRDVLAGLSDAEARRVRAQLAAAACPAHHPATLAVHPGLRGTEVADLSGPAEVGGVGFGALPCWDAEAVRVFERRVRGMCGAGQAVAHAGGGCAGQAVAAAGGGCAGQAVAAAGGGSAGQAVAAAGPPPHPPCLSAVCAEMLAWLLERDHELEQLAGFARLTTKWAAKWPAFKGPGQELLGGITQWVRAKYGFTLTLSTRLLP